MTDLVSLLEARIQRVVAPTGASDGGTHVVPYYDRQMANEDLLISRQISHLQSSLSEKGKELESAREERDVARKLNREWASAAAWGNGSPMFTPERLIDVMKDLISKANRAETAEARIKELEKALTSAVDALEGWGEHAVFLDPIKAALRSRPEGGE